VAIELTRIAPPDTQIRRFEDNSATISAFVSGQVQLIATGASVASFMISRNPQLSAEYKFVLKDSPNFMGVAGAWARSEGPAQIKWVVGAYVELIRNSPFIVQLFFVFFGLPSLGIKLTPEAASVIAMSVNLGAYATEIVRAGMEATPAGQIDAALSLALNRWQVFMHIVLPPALKRMWPAIVSQIIIVMLGSAVCSQIATEELSYP
jgi:His/Glu/Gln/Arg/opine family amino acid ABC transporter permease subunit